MKDLISNSRKKPIKRGLSENQLHVQNDELLPFLKNYGGNHVSHLIFLQDKEQFWTKDLNVLIVYKQIFDKYVVLGDPIGDESNFHTAIKEFNEFCKGNRVKPIYYQVNPLYMQLYHDAGFRFMKLGEEAIIKLNDFSLAGKKGAKLRTRVNKFARNGFTFRVVEPPHSSKLISEIKSISDCWLGTEKEKGFSVVSFCEEYVSRFPIALLHNPDGKIIAFATLATDYKQTITIDLMRNCRQSPHGTMDVLFTNIIIWAKDAGYPKCSLGMAPLANVGNCKHSFISEKTIRFVYHYGNKKYNFRGLKEFKGKFATDWEPKYLAYKKSFLPIIFLQLILLINRKNQRETVLRKNMVRKILDRKLRFQ
ncbi:phosphatidylglycerol lysyltransferase domain-containing protein [Ureibacillus aquaedulcis]|uniref:Phosphatidylglycerol lysyltransferase domain-containing protein n=1 Tax=Ureibacillus aquaedulcis TaxID=3058421 RepID=A0ABT8GTV5_9BACL|nr:phosphatidylglycerol lysyltransferase domain-containing protein [Ureibacillus sp. BA0131]MDN4494844.1 phosphatidylglycerol lysyltransferase domain-containing protein [Ureibacillus sp. BA0131]